ncbi:MAG: yoqW [Verrucomicrobia bacterium]|nr:yoqW [Verrucomicrobiota bacterium]
MCNRFRAVGREELIRYAREAFGIDWDPERPRYNIAPNTIQAIFVKDDEDKLVATQARWNLIPFFEKGEKAGTSFLRTNARSEEVLGKPSYREPIQKRRCLVPADAFYEWEHLHDGRVKLPYAFELNPTRPFTFAGLWERGNETRPPSFTILTTSPNELVAKIHDRMPVILSDENAHRWVAAGPMTKETLAPFVRPFPAEKMHCHRVNPAINSVRADTAEAAAPANTDDPVASAEQPPAQGELF